MTITATSNKRIFWTLVTLLVAMVSAAVVWMGSSGTALAPEAARLNSTLYNSGASSATYVTTNKQTSGYYLSGSWTPSSLPIGAPCSTTAPIYYNSASPVTLYTVVQGSGSYRRCQ